MSIYELFLRGETLRSRNKDVMGVYYVTSFLFFSANELGSYCMYVYKPLVTFEPLG